MTTSPTRPPLSDADIVRMQRLAEFTIDQDLKTLPKTVAESVVVLADEVRRLRAAIRDHRDGIVDGTSHELQLWSHVEDGGA